MFANTRFPSSLQVSIFLIVTLLAPASHAVVVSTFSGGDVGEGLDFQGNFDYAVNLGGSGGLTIQGLNFTDSSAPGVTVVSEAALNPWSAAPPNFGATANDSALETLTSDLVFSRTNNGGIVDITITLDNLIIGEEYKMQSLFYEQKNDRGFDVLLDGSLLVADFNPGVVAGGIANNVGALISETFTATSTSLVLLLRESATSFPDPNPMISAITLERIPAPAPSPGTLSLMLATLLVPLAKARTKKKDPSSDTLG